MKISKIILIVLLFFIFFEIGLFSSYTIVNGEIPNPGELIDMQIETVTTLFSSENVGSLLIKEPDQINVTNKFDLANAISSKAAVDGVNVENMTITTNQDRSEGNFTANVTAYGYSKPKSDSGSIVITGEPDYKIIASVNIEKGVNGLEAKIDTIKIDSILKVYDSNANAYDSNYSSTKSKSSSKSYSKSYSSNSYNSNGYSGSGSSSSGGSESGGSGSGSESGGSGSGSESGGSGSGGSSDSLNLLIPLFSLIIR